MTDRYFGKVVSLLDEYKVVLNKGSEQGVQDGDKFLIVGIGDVIVDPDTGEELEQLEIVRGQVTATHIQPKISTLESCEFEQAEDVKEIKKVTARGSIAIFGPHDTTTESIKPGKRRLREINGPKAGDMVIKL